MKVYDAAILYYDAKWQFREKNCRKNTTTVSIKQHDAVTLRYKDDACPALDASLMEKCAVTDGKAFLLISTSVNLKFC